MDKHRKHNRLVVAGIAAALAASAFAGNARAATQTVTTTINEAISMTTAPTASVGLGALNPGATGTASGGTVGVTSNVPYTVTVASSDPKMASATDALTLDLSVAATTASGTGIGGSTTSTVANTAAAVIASNGLAGVSDTFGGGGTDSYALELSQQASITDSPGDYSLTLTYTAAKIL